MRKLGLVLFILINIVNAYSISKDTIKIEVSNDLTKGVSLEKAFNSIEKLRKKSGDESFVHILVHGGEYKFDKTIVFEGRCYNNILVSPYNNEKVVFTGGERINPKSIKRKKINDTEVYYIDIKNTGIKKIHGIRSFGFLRPYGASWSELFVNGEPLNLSRWPNDSTVKIGKIISKGSLPYKGDYSNKGGIFEYKESNIDSWKHREDIWISGYFCHGYADDLLPVKRIDAVSKTIETNAPHYFGFDSGKPWNRCYFLNVLDELDINKEYVLDTKNNGVYFKYDEKEPEDVVISNLDQPFFDIYNTYNVCLKNIVFEYSRFLAISMAETHNVVIDNCTFRNMGSAAISVGLGVEPFDDLAEKREGKLVRGLIGSIQQHIYARSDMNRRAGHNNIIRDCFFYNLGSGAISMGGGYRLTLDEGNNIVQNCKIYTTNRVEKTYRPAIHITGVGNKIRGCEISNLPSMAILMHGNNHIIENNYIHNVCYEVDDNGAIYYGRNPTECGNVVRGNFFANIGNDYSCCSVYIDDCTGGMLVENNTFYKAGRFAVLIGGGSDNKIINNLIVDTKFGVHIDNRLDNWANHLLNKDGLFDERIKAVNAFGKVYTKAYPYILNYKNRKSTNPERNIVWGNRLLDVHVLCDNPQWIDILQH